MQRWPISLPAKTWSRAIFLLSGIALLGVVGEAQEPRFTEDNQLIRPEGYREWIFVGSGLGMTYKEEKTNYPLEFSNVYIQPEAYRRFVATGKFPDKTILVMELVSAGSRASINKGGQFEDRFIGIEAAVKDEGRFPEKWAYFSLIGRNGEALARAKPFPKEACWKCHNQHASMDNVFVQFYPVLREARKLPVETPKPEAAQSR